MKLRVTDSGGAISEKEALVSVNNTPPAVEITSPLPGTLYSMVQDEVHFLSADITDLEHGPGQLACAWQFDLHHNDHIHSEPVQTDCEAMAPTSPVGCDGNTYFFRATLTVTDAHGLATTRAVDLLPNCTNAQADLGVSVTDAPDPVPVGGSITYSITVANTGTNNVEGVTVTDTLPAGTTLLSAPGYCSLAAGKVICSLGAFGVGQSESLSLVVRANVLGALVNTVEVTSLTAESNAANNAASASTQVTSSNQVPTAHPQSVSLAEDTSRALTLTGSDPEGGALTFQIATNPAHGSLAGTGASRTYTPAANYHGADGFTFTVRDPSGNTSAPAAVSITIAAVNDPPVATPQTVALNEDTSRPLTLTGSDVDGNPLVFSVVSGPAHGALTGAPPNLTYTPQPNFFGADSFVFRVSDGQAVAQATVSLTVTDVPELSTPPTISNILNQTVAMSRVLGPLAFTVGDVQTAAGALALTRGSSNTTLVPLSGIAFGGSGASRTVTVTPAAGRVGTAIITVTVSDGALVASDTFVLTVVGLPPPWVSQDIGGPGLAGSAWAAGSVFTVKGSGDDIWGTSDSFHFAWRTMTGDGEIRARVTA